MMRLMKRSRDGAAAIEFALLAIPYFIIIFAIFETFMAFMGEQILSNGVDAMQRKLRTGEIAYKQTPTVEDEKKFRAAFCDEISIIIKCTASEINTPTRLFIDVRSFPDFVSIPTKYGLVEGDDGYDLNTGEFQFQPGGSGAINMIRVFYKWQIYTDLVRPYIGNVKLGDKNSKSYFLIVATTAFQNEAYPE